MRRLRKEEEDCDEYKEETGGAGFTGTMHRCRDQQVHAHKCASAPAFFSYCLYTSQAMQLEIKFYVDCRCQGFNAADRLAIINLLATISEYHEIGDRKLYGDSCIPACYFGSKPRTV